MREEQRLRRCFPEFSEASSLILPWKHVEVRFGFCTFVLLSVVTGFVEDCGVPLLDATSIKERLTSSIFFVLSAFGSCVAQILT